MFKGSSSSNSSSVTMNRSRSRGFDCQTPRSPRSNADTSSFLASFRYRFFVKSKSWHGFGICCKFDPNFSTPSTTSTIVRRNSKNLSRKIPIHGYFHSRACFSHLIVFYRQLRFAVITAHRTHRNVGQSLDNRRIFGEERLLCDARHLAIDRFARQRVHHFNLLFTTDRPIDAEIRRFDLIARLRRCDEREFRFVENVRRRQALNDGLDATANGTVPECGWMDGCYMFG